MFKNIFIVMLMVPQIASASIFTGPDEPFWNKFELFETGGSNKIKLEFSDWDLSQKFLTEDTRSIVSINWNFIDKSISLLPQNDAEDEDSEKEEEKPKMSSYHQAKLNAAKTAIDGFKELGEAGIASGNPTIAIWTVGITTLGTIVVLVILFASDSSSSSSKKSNYGFAARPAPIQLFKF
ncbi:hypothetical protein KKF97_12950 [Myxococcota bacterium]|nr:hypothetical protein [Myxococcota bacterium]